jgi:hypothetical protein
VAPGLYETRRNFLGIAARSSQRFQVTMRSSSAADVGIDPAAPS